MESCEMGVVGAPEDVLGRRNASCKFLEPFDEIFFCLPIVEVVEVDVGDDRSEAAVI